MAKVKGPNPFPETALHRVVRSGSLRHRGFWGRGSRFSSWRRRTLLFLLLVGGLLLASALKDDLDRTIREGLLRAFGYALAPVAVWVVGVAVAFRHSRGALFRRWRAWLGTGLLIGAVLGSLAFFNADRGILEDDSLGGALGTYIRGDSVGWAVVRVGALAALGLWVVAPRLSVLTLTWLLVWTARTTGLLWGWLQWTATAAAAVGASRHRVRRGMRALRFPGPRHPTTPYQAPEHQSDVSPPQPIRALALPEPQGGPAPPEPGEIIPSESLEEASLEEEQPVPVTPAGPVFTPLGWTLPPLSLLERGEEVQVMESDKEEVARQIEASLKQYGVDVTVEQIKPGPTVTMFGLVPGWRRRYREVKQRDEADNVIRDQQGKPVTARVEEKSRVRVDSIIAREKDLALALAAPSLRIEAPVPGESVVGVEVPNKHPNLVTLRSAMESEAFLKVMKRGGLPLALGRGSGGEAVAANLVSLPHLLIAGATGSGKSVCINSIIAAILTYASPLDVRLLLVDPKRIELSSYNGIPHLLTPVLMDPDEVVAILKGLIREMFSRYRRMEGMGVRNIQAFNHRAEEQMPYVVVCIDELADLMMAAPYDAERTLTRLAQLGRATGIHLVVATQRPSVDVVTGLIKANFPSRISFAVASQVDSRTILDIVGAEKLLGRGDMLYLAPDAPKPKRVQGAYVSDREIEALVGYWRDQRGPPPPDIPLLVGEAEAQEHFEPDDKGSRDELLERAIELASRYSHLSTSLLQRRLRIGYPRAARLMDQLEDEGVVVAGEPGKSREVARRSVAKEE